MTKSEIDTLQIQIINRQIMELQTNHTLHLLLTLLTLGLWVIGWIAVSSQNKDKRWFHHKQIKSLLEAHEAELTNK